MAENLGIIQAIREIREDSMDGYGVQLATHTIKILITNEQYCCETWGYMSSEDDLQNYVGSELREIRLTDSALNQSVIDSRFSYQEGLRIQFVDFVTNQGVFQLAVYNLDGGYYSHDIRIIQDEEVLLDDYL